MKSALIVDDHPVVRAAIRIVLQAEGFKDIHEASSGIEVLAADPRAPAGLVILDLSLPASTGWKCWRESRPMILSVGF